MQDTSSTVPDNDQDDTGRPGRELLKAKEETIEQLRARVRRLEQDLDARTESYAGGITCSPRPWSASRP